MNKKLQVIRYIIADAFTAILAWSLFFIYRKFSENPQIFEHKEQIYGDAKLYIGLVLIPLFWLTLYLLNGTYRRIYRKSRVKELGQTFIITLLGVIIIFFVVILDDIVISYKSYYKSFCIWNSNAKEVVFAKDDSNYIVYIS